MGSPQIVAMRWLLLLLIASSFTSSYGKHCSSGRAHLSKLGEDLTSAFTLSSDTTLTATEPPQPTYYNAAHGYSPAGVDNTALTRAPAPSLKKTSGNLNKYPIEILKKLINIIRNITKFPSELLGEVNALCDKYLTRAIRERISYIIVTLIAILVRIVVINLEIVAKLAMQIFGEFCFYFPNLSAPIFIFSIKGGKICPFQWVSLDQVAIRNSGDGKEWLLSLPFKFLNVEIIFARIEIQTVLGSPGVGGFNLTAHDVAVNFTLHFTKSVFPVMLPIRTMVDTTIHVEGCTGNQPDSSWISNEIMAYAMKLCDPVLNGVLRIVFNLGQLLRTAAS